MYIYLDLFHKTFFVKYALYVLYVYVSPKMCSIQAMCVCVSVNLIRSYLTYFSIFVLYVAPPPIQYSLKDVCHENPRHIYTLSDLHTTNTSRDTF